MQKIELSTKPFNDSQMIFNVEQKRYILTKEALSDVGIDLSYVYSSDEEINANLKRISLNFYEYLYTQSCMSNFNIRKKPTLEYLYAKDHSLRNEIRDGLLKFVRFDINTQGGTDANYWKNDLEFKDNIIAFLNYSGLLKNSRLTYYAELKDGDL